MNSSVNNRVLHLTLKAEPFEVMLKGEKKTEYREPSKWILSRLNPTKKYDLIKFVNGYGSDKPFFVAKFLGWEFHKGEPTDKVFSNGLIIKIETGVVKIHFGEVSETGNLKAQ